MGHLMDQCLDRLGLAHAFLQGDPVFRGVVIAFRAGFDLFKTDRHRAGLRERRQQLAVTVHLSCELIHAQRRKLLSLRLADIEDRRDPEGRIFDLDDFPDRFALSIQLRSAGSRIQDFTLLLCLVWRGCDDLYPLFSLLHMTLMLWNSCGTWPLWKDRPYRSRSGKGRRCRPPAYR